MTFTDKTFIHAQKKALGSIMFRVSRYGQLNYILRYIHHDKDQKVATHQHVRYKPNLLRFPKYGFGYQRLSLVSILSDLCSYSMIIFKSVFSWKLREAQTFLHRNALFMLVTHPMTAFTRLYDPANQVSILVFSISSLDFSLASNKR